MGQACANIDLNLPDGPRLDALAGIASMFPWPMGRERDEKACGDAAYLVDAVLAQISGGWGALEIAIGEHLAALSIGDRTMKLGYSHIGDYAREELPRGMAGAGDPAVGEPRHSTASGGASGKLRVRSLAPARAIAPTRGHAQPVGRVIRPSGNGLPRHAGLGSARVRQLPPLQQGAAGHGRTHRLPARVVRAEAARGSGTARSLAGRRLSYEKARLLARHLEKQEIPGWIERAQKLTCVGLRRALAGKDQAQMCARGVFQTWLPRTTALVVAAAFQAARKEAKRSLSLGECFVAIAEHFIEVWKPLVAQRNTLQARIRRRDRHFCQVRGCSRPAAHAHHIVPRSQGGSDDPSNLVSLCAAHHLRGVHGGLMRVTGTAPDGLRWVLANGEAFGIGARTAPPPMS